MVLDQFYKVEEEEREEEGSKESFGEDGHGFLGDSWIGVDNILEKSVIERVGFIAKKKS